MGCGGSKPEPEPEPTKTVSNDEMAAIRAKLAEKKDAPGFKKEKTFRRKFDGYKVGGGSKHNIDRKGSLVGKSDSDAVNQRMLEKFPPVIRALTRSFTRGSRASSDGSSGSLFSRSMSRMFTRGSRASKTPPDGTKTDLDYAKEHEAHLAELNDKWRDSNQEAPAASEASKGNKRASFSEGAPPVVA